MSNRDLNLPAQAPSPAPNFLSYNIINIQPLKAAVKLTLTGTPEATKVSKRVLSKVNTLKPMKAAPMAAKAVTDEHSTIFVIEVMG